MTIAKALKVDADTWYRSVRNDPDARDVKWIDSAEDPEMKRHLLMLQLANVASTFQEGNFFKRMNDQLFVLELTYCASSGDLPTNFHSEVERFIPILGGADLKKNLTTWSRAVARHIGLNSSDPALLRVLEKWARYLVIKSKMATFEACGDKKAAQRIVALATGRE